MDYTFTTTIRLWKADAPASRHFITLPVDIASQIRQETASQPRRGRGSVRISARIGRYTRETSIFPDKKTASYLLPLKADVRKQLHLKAGDEVGIAFTLQ